MTLTDFLVARIAEDHSLALAASTDTHGSERWSCEPWMCDEQGSHVAVDPPRMLAECEAKRRIVEGHRSYRHPDDGYVDSVTQKIMRLPPCCANCGTFDGKCPTLRALALPYADHPDYDDEWRSIVFLLPHPPSRLESLMRGPRD